MGIPGRGCSPAGGKFGVHGAFDTVSLVGCGASGKDHPAENVAEYPVLPGGLFDDAADNRQHRPRLYDIPSVFDDRGGH